MLDETADPLVCDISTSRRRPIVPDILRYHIFSHYHGLAHPRVRTSIKLVSRVFVWPSMRRDITRWVRECHACQRNKIQRHTKAPLQKVSPPPKGRFAHVYVDLTGPMEESYGYFYLLVVICKFSRFMHAIPLRGITAAEVTDAFVRHWVALFGCPEHIFSDRGRQFTSHRWRNMGNFMGSKLHHSTSYHPQANASIERLNRTLKQPLRCFEQPGNWYDNLPWVLLSLRNSPKEDLQDASPAEFVFGQPLRLPGDLVDSASVPNSASADEYLKRLRTCVDALEYRPPRPSKRSAYVQESLFDPNVRSVYVRIDSHRTPLMPCYKGPYSVVAKNDKYFILNYRTHLDTVSIDRLKACHAASDFPEAHEGACDSSYLDDYSRETPVTFTRTGRSSRPPVRVSSGFIPTDPVVVS